MTAASMMPTAPAPPTIEMLLLKDVHPSPSNPRKIYNEDKDAELAADIVLRGVLQPVLVRPHPTKPGGYELVFGSRRYRASKLAKVGQIPAMIRTMSDLEVLESQVVENGQREDIHPLEESEAYEQLHTKHALSVEDIAVKVGKSKASVYARMKLLDLIPDARKAFYDGKLTPSTALYVARVPAALQPNVLKELTTPRYKGDDLPSAREAFEIIDRHFMLRLSEASFDRGDAELVPKAGPCNICPKRTGNQKELFGDVKSADVCTDPTCFEAKTAAHRTGEAERLGAKGVKVLAPAKVEHGYTYPPEGFVELDSKSPDTNYEKTYAQALKPVKEQLERTVMFDEKGKTVELVAKSKLPALLKAAGVQRKGPSGAPAVDRKHQAAVKKAHVEARVELLERLTKQGSGDAVWRAIADARGDGTKKELAGMRGGKLVALVVDGLLGNHGYTDDVLLEEMCDAMKIDLKGREKAAIAESKGAVKGMAAMPKRGAKAAKSLPRKPGK